MRRVKSVESGFSIRKALPDNPNGGRRWVGQLVLEIVLVAIGERLLNPFLDLIGSVVTQQIPTQSTILFGTAGLVAIVGSTILGVLLLQRLYKWVKAANRAMQETRVSMPELQKTEVTHPVSPRYVESGTPIIPRDVEPTILTSILFAGIEFYPSRKELQARVLLEDLIDSAHSSVDLLGFTLESWSVGVRDTIRKSLKDGKHFRFIILSPAFKAMKEADDLNQRINLQGRISESLRMLQTIKSELPDVEKGRLDIRTHDLLPIHSIVVIDAESERGVIYVEYYLYGADSRSWVTLSVSKKEQSALFDRYWQSYKYVWDRSKTFP
jgi:hypothetical protein